ncbi:MAG: replication-associated recombination protein A [Bradymonadia bacterium]
MNLFDHAVDQSHAHRPLADAVRPTEIEQLYGQCVADGPLSAVRRMIETDTLTNVLLCGPPGVGKTTLASMIAHKTEATFETLSAVLGGVKELRLLVEAARERRQFHRRKTILFIDEIHRFNKSQQDALLPHLEDGTFVLVGATTENPSFYVNRAVLSRCHVVRMERLDDGAIVSILKRAWSHSVRQARWPNASIDDDCLGLIARRARGDARSALGILERALNLDPKVSSKNLEMALGEAILGHDRAGDSHYDLLSALVKSMRGNAPDAAVFWAQRLLDAGEDPLIILRRCVVFASEDIGHADPNALALAVSTLSALRFIGMPEGIYSVIQAVTYLATAPKSKTILETARRGREAVKMHGHQPVPAHLRNVSHGGFSSDAAFLPTTIQDLRLFEPAPIGHETQFVERLKALDPNRFPPSSESADS